MTVTVTGLTAERMLAIEAACIVDGAVLLNNLMLTQHDGTVIDAGNVRGPQGLVGATGSTGPTGNTGPKGSGFWGTSVDLANITSIGGVAGDYVVNTALVNRNILGVDTPAGSVVRSVTAVTGTLSGTVRGATGAVGPTGYNTAPIGSTLDWAGTDGTIPWEYVLADGRRLDQATYPDGYDFAKIQADAGNTMWTYRTSDFTFTVPNLVDKFVLAKGAKLLGATGGAETVLLTAAQSGLKDHSHSVSEQYYEDRNYSGNPGVGTSPLYPSATNGWNGVGTHSVGTSGSGSSSAASAHENMPPYIALGKLVKVRGVTASATVIQGPTGATGAAGASNFLPVVTTLPAVTSADHGKEVRLLVDEAGTYGGPFIWSCMYRHFKADGVTVNPETYKWVVISSTPLRKNAGIAANQDLTNSSYVAPSNTPAIVIPFVGIYDIEFGHESVTNANNVWGYLGPSVNGGAITDGTDTAVTQGASIQFSVVKNIRRTVTAVGQTIDLRAKVGGGGTMFFRQPWMLITPVRIG